jgi:putative ABC transport system permease protein
VRESIRQAIRSVRRRRGYAAATILTIALGVGVNAAVFTLLDDVLLRPLPFPQPQELVVVHQTDRVNDTLREPASVPDYLDFRAETTTLGAIGAYSNLTLALAVPGGSPERIAVTAASASLLDVLGRSPTLGRAFAPADDAKGAAPVALLSHALWQRRFGGDPAVIGRPITLDGEPFSVVGVLPPDLELPESDAWVPQLPNAFLPDSRGVHGTRVIARLADGVPLERARAELDAIAARLEARYPDDNAGRGVFVEPLASWLVGDSQRTLLLLAAAVGLVLLVCCVNVGGLALAQTTAREGELALRLSLGARPRDLLRQLFVESLLLAAVGATLGALAAQPLLTFLLGVAPESLPRAVDPRPDPALFLFSLGAALAVAFAVALVAAQRVTRTPAARALGGRSGESAGTARLRRALVVAQLAGAVVLAACAALLVLSFARLADEDPGVSHTDTLVARSVLPAQSYPMPARGDYPNWPQAFSFYDRVLAELVRLPGMESAAIALNHPMQSGFTSRVTIEGATVPPEKNEEMRIRPVTAGYFATVGLPVVAGRGLADSDRVDAPNVLVVNQAFARRYFPGADPVERLAQFWGTERRIVGVVGDERFFGLDRASAPAVYPPLHQVPMNDVVVLARVAGEASAASAALEKAIHRVDPEVAVATVEPFSRLIRGTLATPRLRTLLFSLFGLLALSLAAVGVYGVVAFDVERRRRELAVRLALGAPPRAVVGGVLASALRLAGAGGLLGLAGALAAGQLLSSVLHRTSSLDPRALVVGVAAAVALALAAAAQPAVRAARLDPATTLREE